MDRYKIKIISILRKYGIEKAALFGSAVTGDMKETSDIDILVQMPAGSSLFDILRVKVNLEENLGKKVDLVQYKAIKEPLRKEILSHQIPIL